MISRKTKETDITVKINKDQKVNISTGNGFFDHMLNALFFHAGIGIDIKIIGDIETGFHHSVEDLGIVLGELMRDTIKNKRSINRYASNYSPMDEALVLLVMDISNRSYLNYSVDYTLPYIAGFPLELIEEFLIAFVNNSRITLHVRKIEGRNSHHVAEAIFKGLGRLLGQAFSSKPLGIPSTKGAI